MTRLIAAQSTALSKSALIGRLIAPVEVIDIPGQKIYYLVKGGERNRHKEADTAMLVDKGNRVQVGYWPTSGEHQVVENVSWEELPRVIEDLVGAGFGRPMPQPKTDLGHGPTIELDRLPKPVYRLMS